MHVCILTTGFPRFQGDLFGAFVLEMARALVAGGTQVTVVAPHEKGIARVETVDGIEVRRFRYFLPGLQAVAYGGGIPTNLRSSWLARLQVPLFLLAFACAARRWGRTCDLYHCQWTITAAVAWLANRGHRRPILLSVRGSDMMLSDHSIGRHMNRWLVSRADTITAVSEQIAGRLAEHGVGAKTHVVANGVSDRFLPKDRLASRHELQLPAEAIICLFVGMLVPVKGLDVLLQAVSQIDNERLLLVLVGDGPERAALEHCVEHLGLSERVKFVGACSSDDVPKWMAASDLLVLSSLSEGRPNVVLEAHASGRATVATDVGGTGELIEHEQTGLLVPPSDPVALAEALRALIDDDNRRDRMGKQARQRLLEKGLTWQGTATAIRTLYDQMMERRACVAS
jgi:glycosyltransferase involved in cell wall biosynthesis